MAQKPWMKRRPNETVAQWNARTNRTCYGCGEEFANMKATDQHEETCHKVRGSSGKKSR